MTLDEMKAEITKQIMRAIGDSGCGWYFKFKLDDGSYKKEGKRKEIEGELVFEAGIPSRKKVHRLKFGWRELPGVGFQAPEDCVMDITPASLFRQLYLQTVMSQPPTESS